MKKNLILVLSILLVVGCELRNGTYSDFYSNGQKSFEKNFSNGVEDGKWTHWYENGQKNVEGNYINGKKDGEWIWWNEDGTKIVRDNYKNGEPYYEKP